MLNHEGLPTPNVMVKIPDNGGYSIKIRELG